MPTTRSTSEMDRKTHLNTQKLQQAEKLIHAWMEEHQAELPNERLDLLVSAELACMDEINFQKAGI